MHPLERALEVVGLLQLEQRFQQRRQALLASRVLCNLQVAGHL